MRKHISKIAAALIGAFAISLFACPTFAGANSEQYVTEEDGQTVVYITTYVDPDPSFEEMKVVWHDENGTKYVNTYKQRPQESDPIINSTVTWYDDAGNKYVRDDNSNTVTVYDAEGNVLAVM